MNAKDRLIVALDVPGADPARRLVDTLAGEVGLFKVGSQLFTAAGPALVSELVARGAGVFLDLKYHDIPNTVAEAMRAAAGLGVTLVDAHALGGRAMLRGAAEALAAGTPSGATRARLLAITVLTSHDETTLAELGLAGPIAAAVPRLAQLAQGAGADGVVASPHEVALIRAACGPGFLIVTPGIRPLGSAAGDQARLATPGAAVKAGADYIVVGRPITAAPDARDAARAIVDELARAS
jgi:orotidine-5'-phosphate decarboxylase